MLSGCRQRGWLCFTDDDTLWFLRDSGRETFSALVRFHEDIVAKPIASAGLTYL